MESKDIRTCDLIKVIHCMVSQICLVCLIIENAQSYQLLITRQFVCVLSRDFYESVGKDLTYLNCILLSINFDLPFELYFLRMILHSEERILFRSDCGDELLLCARHRCVGLNIPELLQKGTFGIIVPSHCLMMVKIHSSVACLETVEEILGKILEEGRIGLYLKGIYYMLTSLNASD